MKKSFGTKNNDNTDLTPTTHVIANETELAKREGVLEERERIFNEKAKVLEDKLSKNEQIRKDLIEKLEKAAKLSPEEAKDLLLQNLDKELADEISKKVKSAEETIKLQADEKSKEILANAMYDGYADYISEFTTSTVNLPDEEMKGRIIGKEGRNIKAFEQSTGVDVLMDDENP